MLRWYFIVAIIVAVLGAVGVTMWWFLFRTARVLSVNVANRLGTQSGSFSAGDTISIRIDTPQPSADFNVDVDFYDGKNWIEVAHSTRARHLVYMIPYRTFALTAKVRAQVNFNGETKESGVFSVVPTFELNSGPGALTRTVPVKQGSRYRYSFTVDPSINWGKRMSFSVTDDATLTNWTEDYVGPVSFDDNNLSQLIAYWLPHNVTAHKKSVYLRIRTYDLVQNGYPEELEIVTPGSIVVQTAPSGGGSKYGDSSVSTVALPVPYVYAPGKTLVLSIVYHGLWNDQWTAATFSARNIITHQDLTADFFAEQPTFSHFDDLTNMAVYTMTIPAKFETQPSGSTVDSRKQLEVNVKTELSPEARFWSAGFSVISNWTPDLSKFDLMPTFDVQADLSAGEVTTGSPYWFYPGQTIEFFVTWIGPAYAAQLVEFTSQPAAPTLLSSMTLDPSSTGTAGAGTHRARYTLTIPSTFLVSQPASSPSAVIYNGEIMIGVHLTGKPEGAIWTPLMEIQPFFTFSPNANTQAETVIYTNSLMASTLTFKLTNIQGAAALTPNTTFTYGLARSDVYRQESDGVPLNARSTDTIEYVNGSNVTVPLLRVDMEAAGMLATTKTDSFFRVFIAAPCTVDGKPYVIPLVNTDLKYKSTTYLSTPTDISIPNVWPVSFTHLSFTLEDQWKGRTNVPAPEFTFIVDFTKPIFIDSLYFQATGKFRTPSGRFLKVPYVRDNTQVNNGSMEETTEADGDWFTIYTDSSNKVGVTNLYVTAATNTTYVWPNIRANQDPNQNNLIYLMLSNNTPPTVLFTSMTSSLAPGSGCIEGGCHWNYTATMANLGYNVWFDSLYTTLDNFAPIV